ncbi:hydantoin utilization protein B [Acuticoccus sediminis]|uniref:Hydantoin utilization protein B n=1 Tax=Acuticoccus sediminis TaxID=2184697 RepID=A0A8B2NQD7_9HYPH|nr:hydantoinase B/oxoprolinase family protein [Acuticoccus sediminis]RAI02105.1 hydantoin utilization protein B [Acuticoccus sediminis]
MRIDTATLQVLANHCAAAAEAMGYTLMRTAYSTFVKETEDFSCQVMTLAGETVASPMSMGATWYTGLDYGPVIERFDDYRPGDVYCTNDPYSGFVATHPPDLHMWMPVFHGGELVCFVGNHIHNTDIGGAVPASLSRTLTEVHQEGIRIPPMRLMRDGVLNTDVLDVMNLNVRVPEQNIGDFNAQLSCVITGERKVRAIIERFGLETFRDGLHDLLDYAEAQARAVIASIPDGDYTFADYADEDAAGGYPARICVTARIRGDEVTLDFTGTDPQLASSLNMPTGGRQRHSLITVGLIYVLKALDPTITLNSGSVRNLTSVLPEGTVVNCTFPAAVGMRSLLSNVTQTVIIGAFGRALPDRLPASPGSGLSLLNVRTATREGRTVMASIGPVGGGAGGGPYADGAEGSGANMSFLKNTPVEINEAEVPVRIRKYGLVPDSGGAGRWRGGSALMMEFQTFSPGAMVTARNRDRSLMSAWGTAGGRAGAPSRFVRNPGQPDAEELGNTDIVHLEPGDILLLEGPGAGGYGPPHERPVESVLADVRRGFISPGSARADYGVAVDPARPDGHDTAETARLRAGLAQTASTGHFGHGEGRLAFERVWTEARYAALTTLLAAVPITWRYFVKHRIFKALGSDEAGPDGGAHDVVAAYEALATRFADLPPVPAALHPVHAAAK